MTTSAAVRSRLVDTLRRDLIGPGPQDADLVRERLKEKPSGWYVTGFLAPVPEPAGPSDVPADGSGKQDDEGEAFEEGDPLVGEDIGSDSEAGPARAADDGEDDAPPTVRIRAPSSLGLTVLLDAEVREVQVNLTWGDYVTVPPLSEEELLDDGAGAPEVVWDRVPGVANLRVPVPADGKRKTITVPASGGAQRPLGALQLEVHARPYDVMDSDGTMCRLRVLTVMVVNRRDSVRRRYQDVTYAFQVRLAVRCASGLQPRANMRGFGSSDLDEATFQLAFILLNLPGIADPRDPSARRRPALLPDRRRQDRGVPRPRRVRHGAAPAAPPGRQGTRGRGRQRDHALHAAAAHARSARPRRRARVRARARARAERARYGEWPFEIGLWVGKAATPNVMGARATGGRTRRARRCGSSRRPARQAVADPARDLPVVRHALRRRNSFALLPDDDQPRELRIVCTNFECDFTRDRPLPIVAVDEPIYRRLPPSSSRRWTSSRRCRGSGSPARCSAAPTATTRRLLRPRRARQGAAARAAAAAARPRHPGRAAPDLRAARHDGRPVRDGDRGALRARDRTAAPSARRSSPRPPPCAARRTRSRRSSPAPSRSLPAARPRPPRLVLRPDGARPRDAGAALPRHRRAGRNPKVVMRKRVAALMGAAERAYRDAGGHKNKRTRPTRT
jgi:hypothetical protein